MKRALIEAERATRKGEVPIGAVMVRAGEIISASHNQVEELHDATAHAEILAIRETCSKLGNWRLSDCELYVTIEPCAMCLGAIRLARISKVHFGSGDSRYGAISKRWDLASDPILGPVPAINSGEAGELCSNLMKGFFRNLRAADSEAAIP